MIEKDLNFYKQNIDKRVWKKALKKNKDVNPKPFKSNFLKNTVKDVIPHPITGKPAYLFYEDDSYVECHICEVTN
jgi:hypothetical protein